MTRTKPAVSIALILVSIIINFASYNKVYAEQKTFKDVLKRTVTINYPPKRIISIAPSVTEILFALGLDEEIVGVTEFCDYPTKAKQKAKIGGYYNPSAEMIVALQPDIAVAIADGPNKAFVEKLTKLGVRCFVINPQTVDDILKTMVILSAVTGKEKPAKKTIDLMKARVAKVDKRLKAIPVEQRPKVFYALDNVNLWTTGKNTFVNDLITRAGGINIAGDSKGWFKYSLEGLILKNPNVIITGKTEKEKHVSILAEWQKYNMLPAVTNNRVYTIDNDWLSRAGPRAIDALEKLVEILHKEPRQEK